MHLKKNRRICDMKCDCCGRKKKIMESFENLGKGGNVCKECSDLLYRIHDAVVEKNKEDYANYSEQVRKDFEKTSNKEFEQWFEKEYMERNHM